MRLRAKTAEERSVPRDDVVGVETVEACCLRPADERRVAEDTDAVDGRERLGPLGRRIAVGVVDVEVRDPALFVESRDVLGRAGRRSTTIRLDVESRCRGPRSWPPARPSRGARARASRNPTRTRRASRRPRRRSRASVPRRSSRSTTSTGRAAGSTASRGQARRRARRTSEPNRRPWPGSSTTGSRRSRPARSLVAGRRRPPARRTQPAAIAAATITGSRRPVNAARDNTSRRRPTRLRSRLDGRHTGT